MTVGSSCGTTIAIVGVGGESARLALADDAIPLTLFPPPLDDDAPPFFAPAADADASPFIREVGLELNLYNFQFHKKSVK